MANLPIGLPGSSSTAVTHIPYVANGAGWSGELMLVNPTEKTLSGRQLWHGLSGQLHRELRYSVPAGGMLLYKSPKGSAPFEPEQVDIVPDPNQLSPQTTSIRLLTRSGAAATLVTVPAVPALVDSRVYAEISDAIATDIVIKNPSTDAAIVTLRAVSQDKTIEVPGSASVVVGVDEIPLMRVARQALVHIQSKTPVGAIAVRSLTQLTGGPAAATVSSNVQTASSFPYFVTGGGFQTTFAVFADSLSPISGSMEFFGPDGQRLDLPVTIK